MGVSSYDFLRHLFLCFFPGEDGPHVVIATFGQRHILDRHGGRHLVYHILLLGRQWFSAYLGSPFRDIILYIIIALILQDGTLRFIFLHPVPRHIGAGKNELSNRVFAF